MSSAGGLIHVMPVVFGRVLIGHVKFGSMSLWSPLNRFECLVALKFDRVLLVSSQMSGWSRHLCLVAPSMFGRAIYVWSRHYQCLGLIISCLNLVSDLL